jgi:hypothetical protein
LSTAWAVAVAVVFVWLGMVLAVSFIETPLRFRAPGVTLKIGLGIGRLVFRTFNAVESLLAVAALAALLMASAPLCVVVSFLVALAALVIQVLVVRRWLNRRSDAVMAGAEGPRSRGHFAYIGLEAVKAAALLTTGILLLTV